MDAIVMMEPQSVSLSEEYFVKNFTYIYKIIVERNIEILNNDMIG